VVLRLVWEIFSSLSSYVFDLSLLFDAATGTGGSKKTPAAFSPNGAAITDAARL
jgi:hypothetical protein